MGKRILGCWPDVSQKGLFQEIKLGWEGGGDDIPDTRGNRTAGFSSMNLVGGSGES